MAGDQNQPWAPGAATAPQDVWQTFRTMANSLTALVVPRYATESQLLTYYPNGGAASTYPSLANVNNTLWRYTGTSWTTETSGVSSVNGLTGAVLLTAALIRVATGGATLDQMLPAIAFSASDLNVSYGVTRSATGSAGLSWDPVVQMVNGIAATAANHSNVVLTGDNIAVSATDQTPISQALLHGNVQAGTATFQGSLVTGAVATMYANYATPYTDDPIVVFSPLIAGLTLTRFSTTTSQAMFMVTYSGSTTIPAGTPIVSWIATTGQIAPYVTTDPATWSITASQQSATFTVNTNQSTWTASSDATWLTITPTSGTDGTQLTATATQNTGTQRRATITLTAGTATTTLEVTQFAAPQTPTISVSPNSLFVGASSTTQTITVTTNQSGWTASGIPSWISLSVTSGVSGSTIQATISQNQGSSSRSGTITFTAGTATTTLGVTQAAPVAKPATRYIATMVGPSDQAAQTDVAVTLDPQDPGNQTGGIQIVSSGDTTTISLPSGHSYACIGTVTASLSNVGPNGGTVILAIGDSQAIAAGTIDAGASEITFDINGSGIGAVTGNLQLVVMDNETGILGSVTSGNMQIVAS
jgi:hypothetical protein